MAGGFAHVTAAATAFGRRGEVEGLTAAEKAGISAFLSFVEVGAVGPDYPYLGGQSEWADDMHYKSTGETIRHGVRALRFVSPGATRHKMLAWLLGYCAHVATDLTIHPVVEKIVGEYAENKTDHRICEMNQDAYIWPRRNLGEVGLADYFDLIIRPCTTADGEFDPDIRRLWEEMLRRSYPEHFASEAPNFSAWNRGFRRIVDTVDDLGRLIPFTRHMLAAVGGAYPAFNDVDRKFIDTLQTPDGVMSYDAVFDRAVRSIIRLWSIVGRALNAPGSADADRILAEIPDGNLDTGKRLADNTIYIFWGAA